MLTQVLKRVIAYISKIKEGNSSLVNIAFQSELNYDPNIFNFVKNFNLDIDDLQSKSKYVVKKTVNYNYNRSWLTVLKESPKALSYILYKNNVCLENYLYLVKNKEQRKALSRFRLSYHGLLIEIEIEKGRHQKAPLERND